VTGVVATFADGELDGDTFIVTGNTMIPVQPDAVAGFDAGATVSAELTIPAQTARELRITSDIAAESAKGETVLDAIDAPLEAASVTEIHVAAAAAVATHYVDIAVNVNGDGYQQPSTAAITQAIADASAYWVANTGGVFPGFTVRSTVRYTSKLKCGADAEDWWMEAAAKLGTNINAYLDDSGQHLVLIGECSHEGKAALGSVGESLSSGGVVLTQANVYANSYAPQLLNGLLAHEFGHNFSLNHANAVSTEGCTITSVPAYTQITGCGTYEYGDEWSVMGFGLPLSWVPVLDVARLDQLGLTTPTTLAAQSGSAKATYDLTAVGASGGRKGVKVAVASGTYYVEYRNATGEPLGYFLDTGNCTAEWEPSPTCTTGIIPEGPGVRVLLLQAGANTRVESVRSHLESATFGEMALDQGDWFRSSSGDLNISIDSISGDVASITVTTGSMPRVSPVSVTLGMPVLGEPVTAVPSVPAGATVTYRWYRNGVELAGRTSDTYTPVAADAGTKLTVRVEARTDAASPSQAVATSAVVPGAPTLGGAVRVGSAVAAAGVWPSGTVLTYQWLLNGAAVSGATGATYTPPVSALGKKLSVRVTGAGDGWGSVTLTSAAVAIAAGALTAPIPVISGTSAVGHKLTVSRGTWTAGTTFKYRWYANGTAISGATSSSFTVPSKLAGKKLTVKVTGTKTGYASKTVTSAAVGVPIASAAYITGTARVGHTLAAHHGTWTSGTSFAYQWYANGVAITGATKSTYRATTAVVGKRITVRVKGTKAGYATVYRTSPATAKVTR
jgi:hypothetical protein